MYEQQLSIVKDQQTIGNEQQKLIGLYQATIASHLTIDQQHQEQHDLQSQKINLLQLQIIELQKFIFSGKQEKFKLGSDCNEQQIALFANDALGEVAVENIKHV